ncbi:LEAF RUST 10 DISEASE-RESISTANCE LOCUS RECEPTOR-LIKE PROTEIN KINASE-like 2.4 [Durio zibethinus]|uniref:LEAF RUST 10 DISEASE-RESISTANCE LOCUS RECEPTOR-LIKE PROTEIN KINASE-like 2.4 n=1 Tax=Durio zibethinus TaxID=66656 RepID=A0A6P5Y4Y9_DURZI|nr:LEAF RUST 10 DISEASE-RESISTANCE LOCUS RECEPTOR-LIKE PROTEIN KINASE-like 2.4 [Durio zibethinus]
MLRAKLPLFCLLLSLALSRLPDACIAARLLSKDCDSSFCGNVNISYPFRLNTQPDRCGFSWFELVCENNRTIFPMKYGNFYVQDISYVNRTIHLLDVSLDNDNCSIPHSSYPWYTPSGNSIGLFLDGRYDSTAEFSVMYLVNCKMKMINSSVYIDASRCSTNRSNSPTPPTS